ncbi:MAG: hypothetical protein HEEMFOPI_01604 [Holosporales bacterium]
MKFKLYACALVHSLYAAQDLKSTHLADVDTPSQFLSPQNDQQYCQMATAPKDDEFEEESKTVPVSPMNKQYVDYDQDVTVTEERLDNVSITYRGQKILSSLDGTFLLDDNTKQYLHISKRENDANRMANDQSRLFVYTVYTHQIPDNERGNIRTNMAICYKLNGKILYRPFSNGRSILKDIIRNEVMFFNNTTGSFSQALWDLKDKINFILIN